MRSVFKPEYTFLKTGKTMAEKTHRVKCMLFRGASRSPRAGIDWLGGVDGCRGGWVGAFAHFSQRGDLQWLYLDRHSSFAEVLEAARRVAVLAVDIPIGLLDVPHPGGRGCDRLARAQLRGRRGSVFTPPVRAALGARSHREAQRRNGTGLSRQSFNILPRIREVDRLLTPRLQQRVFEAHPELAFARLADRPLRHSKKSAPGRAERLRLLARRLGLSTRALRALHAGYPKHEESPSMTCSMRSR